MAQKSQLNSTVETIIAGGDILNRKLVNKVNDLYGGNVKIVNEYGPLRLQLVALLMSLIPVLILMKHYQLVNQLIMLRYIC